MQGDPAEAVDRVRDGHLLLLHHSEPDRRASVAAWVRRGLAQGEKVVYTQLPEEADRSLLGILDEHGVDVHAATADGQLSILPTREFYPPEGQVEMVRRALAGGYRAVRLSAEEHVALSVLSEDHHQQIEQGMEDICRSLPVSTMCQYNARTTVGQRLLAVVASHPRAVLATQLCLRRHADTIALEGELDLASSEVLLLYLRVATDSCAPPASLWLSLRDLSFIDVAGSRALLLGTEPFRNAGGQVLIESAQAQVSRTLRLLGVDRQRHVHLKE